MLFGVGVLQRERARLGAGPRNSRPAQIDPLGLIRQPELTVIVADVRGLVTALGADR